MQERDDNYGMDEPKEKPLIVRFDEAYAEWSKWENCVQRLERELEDAKVRAAIYKKEQERLQEELETVRRLRRAGSSTS